MSSCLPSLVCSAHCNPSPPDGFFPDSCMGKRNSNLLFPGPWHGFPWLSIHLSSTLLIHLIPGHFFWLFGPKKKKKEAAPLCFFRWLFERRDLQSPEWVKWCTATSWPEAICLSILWRPPLSRGSVKHRLENPWHNRKQQPQNPYRVTKSFPRESLRFLVQGSPVWVENNFWANSFCFQLGSSLQILLHLEKF